MRIGREELWHNKAAEDVRKKLSGGKITQAHKESTLNVTGGHAITFRESNTPGSEHTAEVHFNVPRKPVKATLRRSGEIKISQEGPEDGISFRNKRSFTRFHELVVHARTALLKRAP